MAISGFGLSAFSVQLSVKTKKKQVIKLMADRSLLKFLISGWKLFGILKYPF